MHVVTFLCVKIESIKESKGCSFLRARCFVFNERKLREADTRRKMSHDKAVSKFWLYSLVKLSEICERHMNEDKVGTCSLYKLLDERRRAFSMKLFSMA